jgi:drug/metabolite transporter (DMT)-like permease
MLLFIQTISAIIGIVVAALFQQHTNPPWPVYAAIAAACGWAGTWLYARWRYGRGVIVTSSLPAERRSER